MDVLRRNGIGVDRTRREEKLARVRRGHGRVQGADAAARLPGRRAGQRKAMQSILSAVAARAPGARAEADRVGQVEYRRPRRTWPSWPPRTLLRRLRRLQRRPRSCVSTYLSKMGRPRLTRGSATCWRRAGPTAAAASTSRTCRGRRTRRAPPARSAAASSRARGGSSSTATTPRSSWSSSATSSRTAVRPAPPRWPTWSTAARTSTGSSPPPCWARTPGTSPRRSATPSSRSPSAGRAAWAPRAAAGRQERLRHGPDRSRRSRSASTAYHRLCPELDRFLEDEVDTGAGHRRGRCDLTPAAVPPGDRARPYDRDDPRRPPAPGLARRHAAEGARASERPVTAAARPALHAGGDRLLLGAAQPVCRSSSTRSPASMHASAAGRTRGSGRRSATGPAAGRSSPSPAGCGPTRPSAAAATASSRARRPTARSWRCGWSGGPATSSSTSSTTSSSSSRPPTTGSRGGSPRSRS